jgi:uncharacterized membrane protein
MTALDRIGRAAGVAAMNSINAVILRSLFMPVFFGSTLCSLALVIIGALNWSEPGALEAAAGGAIYVLGMFVVTMVFNVPLNSQLAAVDPASDAAEPVWRRYLEDWVLWNHVRTIAATIGCALFIAALAAN